MKKVHKTALGQTIDFDSLMAQNGSTIAVGNAKVNARGDELGPGGKVVRTRDQVMKDYYALKSPVARDENLPQTIAEQQVAARIPAKEGKVAKEPRPAPVPAPIVEEPVVEEPEVEAPQNSGLDEDDIGPSETTEVEIPLETPAVKPPLRGSLASNMAKNVTVTQKPLPNPKKAYGIKRF